MLHELGLLAEPRYRLSELCDEALRLIADATQDTVYLSERRGDESICTARALGDYPIKALTLDVGIRRPMGVGAGGLAILAALSDTEAARIVQANGPRYSKFGALEPMMLSDAVKQTQVRGYAFLDSVGTPGAAAVGIAFPPENPIAAISVAAISGRLGSERHAAVAIIIRKQVDAICAQLRAA